MKMAKAKQPSTDDVIEQLQQKIEQRKADIAKIKDGSARYKTNRIYDNKNLATVNNISELIGIAAKIKAEKIGFDEIVKELVVDKAPEFKLFGYSYGDWIHDISLQINKLNIKAKEETLAALEKRLNDLMSPELKAKKELAEIVGLMGDL